MTAIQGQDSSEYAPVQMVTVLCDGIMALLEGRLSEGDYRLVEQLYCLRESSGHVRPIDYMDTARAFFDAGGELQYWDGWQTQTA